MEIITLNDLSDMDKSMRDMTEKFVSVKDILKWIDELRKSNDMWRLTVDECFCKLEDILG